VFPNLLLPVSIRSKRGSQIWTKN